MSRRKGRVVEFDEQVGLGVLEPSGGGAHLRFHCTQIADGSRSIPPGTQVSFVVIPGRGGTWEAADLQVHEADPHT